MAAPGNGDTVSGIRSTKGCWTCRLRRKKCDETHPSCHTCRDLGVRCQGYGPRPPWMDRGPRERQEAEKVKAAIARNRYKGRRRPSRGSYDSALEHDRIQAALSDEVSNDNEPQTPRQMSTAPTELPSMLSFSATSNDSLLADMLTWSGDTPSVTHGMGVSFPQLPSMTSPFSDLSELQHANGFQWDHIHLSGDELLDSSPRPIDMEVTALGHNELQTGTPGALVNTMSFASTEHMRGLGISAPLVCNPPSDTTSSSNPGIYTGLLSVDRAMYLSYYLGTVAHVQFSFDGSQRTGNHEWLYFILFCSDHAMQISLILSKAYLCFATNSGQVANSDEYRNHVWEMRKSLPVPIPATSGPDRQQQRSLAIVGCTSLLQAMYLERLYRGCHEWQSNLCQARPYVQTLILYASGFEQSTAPSSDLLRIQYSAEKILLGHFVWFDILATASCNRGSFLEVNHTHILESGATNLQHVCGCDNWIVTVLHNISMLNIWKKQVEAQQTLSVMQLGTRGATIQRSLSDHLSHIEASFTTKCIGTQNITVCRDISKIVTLVYARAAVVYLHVVVSGPYPDLPEIRTGVTELIESIKALAREMELSRMSWPLCVAACFASDEELKVLRVLIGDCRNPCGLFANSCDALKIAEECRRLRDEEGINCDWTSTMDIMQKHFLLG